MRYQSFLNSSLDLMAEVPAMGPKPAQNIVPLGIKRMMGKAQESRIGYGRWTRDLVVYHGPRWLLQCSDREQFRCNAASKDNFTCPKGGPQTFLSFCRRPKCAPQPNTLNTSALQFHLVTIWNVHRWDTVIQLPLENSARKKSVCIAIMASVF